MKILYDGSKYNHDATQYEYDVKLINLYIKIYNALKKGKIIETSFENEEWQLFKIGDEVFVDVVYRIRND